MATDPARAHAPRAADGEPRFRLVLPEGPNDEVPGGRVVRRAILWVALVFMGLLVAAAAVLFVVEMDVTVTGHGALEPAEIRLVRALESGIVIEVPVSAGDTVVPGMVLLRLDPLEHRQALADLQSRHRQRSLEHHKATAAQPIEVARQRDRTETARTAVVQARASLRAELVNRDMPPNVDSVLEHHAPGSAVALDLSVSALQAALAAARSEANGLRLLELAEFDRARERAELAFLARQIETARERLERLTVIAPGAGVVLTDDLQRLVGGRVQAGDLLLDIGDPSRWRTRLLVPAHDVHRVRAGDSVRVTLSAFQREDHHRVDGIVRFVGSQPAVAQTVPPSGGVPGGGYRVDVALDEEQLTLLGRDRLRAGYAAEGKIVTRSGKALKLLWGSLRERWDR